MTLSEGELSRLFRVRKTLMEMLSDRGYLVGDFEINMSKYEFLQKYGENMKREDLVLQKAKRNNSSDQIYVFFPEEPKVGVKTMKTYTERMKKEDVFQAILIVQQNLTPFARTCISEISTKFHLEVFQCHSYSLGGCTSVICFIGVALKFIILPICCCVAWLMLLDRNLWCGISKMPGSHMGLPSPRHGQKAVKRRELPRIQITDPIARYYGLKRGQVVKIIRPSETAGRYVTYRYVV
ncbi:hypothetical protein RDI58_007937 [Solanum bulbocastanum]|uniref:Uncharacterized protein n=1 Tax=Solanum bulbocastanum TaxID=147425 RepID=A0AAN8YI58_SOLBU